MRKILLASLTLELLVGSAGLAMMSPSPKRASAPRSSNPTTTAQASFVAQRNHSSGIIMSRDIVDRFPGATFLGEAEFASAIIGRRFRYREVATGTLIHRPKEVFLEGGRYELHGLRAISRGTYAVQDGFVLIDCPGSFLGLGNERFFFHHEGKLLTTGAAVGNAIYELIPES